MAESVPLLPPVQSQKHYEGLKLFVTGATSPCKGYQRIIDVSTSDRQSGASLTWTFSQVLLPDDSRIWGPGQEEDGDGAESRGGQSHSAGPQHGLPLRHDVLCPGGHHTALLLRQVRTGCLKGCFSPENRNLFWCVFFALRPSVSVWLHRQSAGNDSIITGCLCDKRKRRRGKEETKETTG